MELYNLAREELQEILIQLEKALLFHNQWHSNLVRTLACQLPADQLDIAPHAHEACLFGQWFYSKEPGKLHDISGFHALGKAHELMHAQATKLLVQASNGKVVSTVDFDKFSDSLKHMRAEILALEGELKSVLYNQDELTGAISKAGILPALREQQALAKRKLSPCCIVMVDLDYFKSINDVHGHLVGDYVLASSVRYLIKHLRTYDKVFRYGGEEFLLVMQHIALEACSEMVDRLREGLAMMPINYNGIPTIHITASFGLAQLDPDASIETSIDRADKAMYAAKSAGRNCVKLWDSGMQAE